MKRIIITALLAALMVLPATALARHGHSHGIHRHHGQVGTITSFDSATSELVITTTKGRALSALVTDETRLQCEPPADDGPNHDTGDDNGGGNDDNAGDDHGNGNGHQGDQPSTCTTDDLVAGTAVLRARIDLSGDDAVWTKLKLQPAA
jgi:hypothetical protein